MQTRRWCGQDHANVSVESCTSSDRQQRRPDVRRNSVDMTLQPADDWQQNADVALMQSRRLERSEQPSTEEQYRSDSIAWSCRVCTWHAQVRRANEALSSACISCVRPRSTSGYHWPHELPRLTLVVACWWLPLEPRYSPLVWCIIKHNQPKRRTFKKLTLVSGNHTCLHSVDIAYRLISYTGLILKIIVHKPCQFRCSNDSAVCWCQVPPLSRRSSDNHRWRWLLRVDYSR